MELGQSRISRRFDELGRDGLDNGVIGGFALSLVLISIAVIFSGRGLTFFNPLSLLIVLGGTFGATLVNYSIRDIKHAFDWLQKIVVFEDYNPKERVATLVSYAQEIKKEGLLVLEQRAGESADSFLRMALELVVDGQPPAEIKQILENEMRSALERANRAVHVFQTMGVYAPAMGLIGTLIGLIELLSGLDQPSTVGPAMAVALVTTLYGAVMANLVFIPISGKIRNRSDEEAYIKAMTVEGIVSLAHQENSVVLEQRLSSFRALQA